MQPQKNTFFQRIARSLTRDKEMPFTQKLRKGMRFIISMMLARIYLRKCDKVGKRARSRGRPFIDNNGKMIIGDDFNIHSRIVRSELSTGHKGVLEIGNDVFINYGASISAQSSVKIGSRIQIGPYAMIIDSDFHEIDDRFATPEGSPVVIEDDVWLGARVMILKGTTIGKGSILAAGSVVTRSIPPYVIAAGVPARVIKQLNPPDRTDSNKKGSASG